MYVINSEQRAEAGRCECLICVLAVRLPDYGRDVRSNATSSEMNQRLCASCYAATCSEKELDVGLVVLLQCFV